MDGLAATKDGLPISADGFGFPGYNQPDHLSIAGNEEQESEKANPVCTLSSDGIGFFGHPNEILLCSKYKLKNVQVPRITAYSTGNYLVQGFTTRCSQRLQA